MIIAIGHLADEYMKSVISCLKLCSEAEQTRKDYEGKETYDLTSPIKDLEIGE